MKKIIKAKSGRHKCRPYILYITLLCFISTFFPEITFSKSKISKVKTIAVLNFENTSKESKDDYLSASIAESLSTFLIKYAKDKIKVVERTQIDKAIVEFAIQNSGLTDEKNAVQVGEFTNATHIIIGSYTVIENTIRINARLISMKTGEGILAESVTGKSGSDTFNQINKLSAKIIESLTGEKVQIQEFKDIENPFQITITIPKKKSSLVWITLGVIGVSVLIYSLTKSEQKTTVNVQQ